MLNRITLITDVRENVRIINVIISNAGTNLELITLQIHVKYGNDLTLPKSGE